MKRHEKYQKRGGFLWKSEQLCNLVRADCGMICARPALPWPHSRYFIYFEMKAMAQSKAVSDRGFTKVSRMIFLPTSILCFPRFGREFAARSGDCSGSIHLISLAPPKFHTEDFAALLWAPVCFLPVRYPNPSVDLALNIPIKEAAAFYGLMSAWNNFS